MKVIKGNIENSLRRGYACHGISLREFSKHILHLPAKSNLMHTASRREFLIMKEFF